MRDPADGHRGGRGPPGVLLERDVMERQLLQEVGQWRVPLTSEPDVQQGRQFLRELLDGPLTFTPESAAAMAS